MGHATVNGRGMKPPYPDQRYSVYTETDHLVIKSKSGADPEGLLLGNPKFQKCDMLMC